jgi:NADH-quinone oxidoreductase subunit C
MTKQEQLVHALREHMPELSECIELACNEVTLTCPNTQLVACLTQLRDGACFAFNQLIDLCGVDYLSFGQSDWETDMASAQGFSRGVERQTVARDEKLPRFAVVYHLLSTSLNQRIRVKAWVHEQEMVVPSVHTLWASANWYEREAYDLFGLLFDGHPDLRRILTDYGFIGHPFRKDFPLSGQVEMRYDAALQKVIYEPVDIQPRVTVPKVIRHDNRYLGENA